MNYLSVFHSVSINNFVYSAIKLRFVLMGSFNHKYRMHHFVLPGGDNTSVSYCAPVSFSFLEYSSLKSSKDFIK